MNFFFPPVRTYFGLRTPYWSPQHPVLEKPLCQFSINLTH